MEAAHSGIAALESVRLISGETWAGIRQTGKMSAMQLQASLFKGSQALISARRAFKPALMAPPKHQRQGCLVRGTKLAEAENSLSPGEPLSIPRCLGPDNAPVSGRAPAQRPTHALVPAHNCEVKEKKKEKKEEEEDDDFSGDEGLSPQQVCWIGLWTTASAP